MGSSQGCKSYSEIEGNLLYLTDQLQLTSQYYLCIITIGEQIVARVWWESISVYPNLYERTMQARIRAMISAAHTNEDLDFALDAIERVSK